MNKYTIDLSLQPTTFDLWHVCLAGAVVILALMLIILLLSVVIGLSRGRKRAVQTVETVETPSEPRIIEKIVEVEKIVEAPAPEPVVLKEATPDAALQFLGMLQKEARFIDFIQEDIAAYSDADIGVAARVVHEGCSKVLKEHFTLAAIRDESEGSKITLNQGFDAASVRLTGNIVGEAPFHGTLVHKGWQVTDMKLPKLTEKYNARIVAAAEVEL